MFEIIVFSLLSLTAVVVCFVLLNCEVKPVPVTHPEDYDASKAECFDDSFVTAICGSIQKRQHCCISEFYVRQVLQELGDRGHLLVIDSEFEKRNSWIG